MFSDLFGKPKIKPHFNVFHDESGDYGHSEWVFTGLFWIEKNDLEELDKDLKNERQKENCYSEVHFSGLPKSFFGEFGNKAKLAKKWYYLWQGKWALRSRFNVLAVNTRHRKYDKSRFSRDFHAYNRFTAMAIKSGLAWCFKNISLMDLNIYSDQKSRRPEGLVGDGISSDNFEQYLCERIGEDTKEYKGPKVNIKEPICCLECKKKKLYSPREEALQMTDLLLGSIKTAVSPETIRETKLWFGEKMALLLSDISKKPWEQKYGLHRRFSISYFPCKKEKISNKGPINILKIENQFDLF
jgi:hypothetical protein